MVPIVSFLKVPAVGLRLPQARLLPLPLLLLIARRIIAGWSMSRASDPPIAHAIALGLLPLLQYLIIGGFSLPTQKLLFLR